MNVYASNDKQTYALQGSWESTAAAQEWATERNMAFAHWWADEGEGPMPEWARTPCEPGQSR